MDQTEIAQSLSSKLSLDQPPVALAFVGEAPAGVETFAGEVPSACTFWRRAESRVFYAPAEAHYNCPIGTMTMGFEMPPAVQEQLGGFMGMMCDCGYVSPEEAAHIPTVGRKSRGIVYGPLASLPVAPDLILVWLTPRQAMLYGEAAGSSRWTGGSPTAVFGRPACAALPAALQKEAPTSSFGCMGMRTFTEVADDRMLVAIPGSVAEDFVKALDAAATANATMQAFYEGHKARFTA
jgi:uncharacterized protein (DUF169 family)